MEEHRHDKKTTTGHRTMTEPTGTEDVLTPPMEGNTGGTLEAGVKNGEPEAPEVPSRVSRDVSRSSAERPRLPHDGGGVTPPG
ncbi:hypothetical protein EYF80_064931 [Liparis tanakae]|uniref:Uncharacterized protein n=1 Tax=Liparis tanakae TaxID=230148 RepID=A0A4Z2E9E0_9TELE|nr:hypothetical protein EYF80_064931 [Liparis tanakae]